MDDDKPILTNIRATNRINHNDWTTIKSRPEFLIFLRNRITYIENSDNRYQLDGSPMFWSIIDWVEENANDLWYIDNTSFYFYSDEDGVAFKLRWA